MKFKGNCAATGIGSLPHASTSAALKLTGEVSEKLKEKYKLP